MAGWRRAVELAMSDEEIATLAALSRSRTELASRVSRAQMLLAYRESAASRKNSAMSHPNIARQFWI
jgi:hypothetical protein